MPSWPCTCLPHAVVTSEHSNGIQSASEGTFTSTARKSTSHRNHTPIPHPPPGLTPTPGGLLPAGAASLASFLADISCAQTSCQLFIILPTSHLEFDVHVIEFQVGSPPWALQPQHIGCDRTTELLEQKGHVTAGLSTVNLLCTVKQPRGSQQLSFLCCHYLVSELT